MSLTTTQTPLACASARSPRAFVARSLRVALVAAIAYGGLELLARRLAPEPLDWNEDLPKLVQYDPIMGWKLRPNAEDYTVDKPVHVNAEGFRDREFPVQRTNGVRRVACVGDSYVYGWGVKLEESLPKQLERELSKDVPTEVMNLGVFGHNAHQALITLRTMAAPYRPDLIVYSMYWDDLLPVRIETLRKERFDSRIAAESPKHGWLWKSLRSSRALYCAVERARALRDTIAPAQGRWREAHEAILAGEDESIEDLWRAEAYELVEMKQVAASFGAKLVVVLWPLEEQVIDDAPRCRWVQNAQKLCDATGVPMVSFFEPLKSLADEGTRPYLPYERHPIPEGYRRCVERLAATIRSEKLVAGK